MVGIDLTMASKGKAKATKTPAPATKAAPAAKASPTKSAATPSTLTEDEMQEIKQAFDLFDNDGSGTIAPSEVSAALASLGSDHSASFFRLLEGIEELGAEITYDQFLAHVADRLGSRNSPEGIERIFYLFNDKGSGNITLPQMKRVAKELGESMTADELEAAIQRVAGGKSEISLEDFTAVMTKKVYK